MFLITGATGNVGRELVRRLAADGAAVRAVTRDPERAAPPAGVEVVAGNPAEPRTLEAALEGVTALFLNPIALGQATGELLALAREKGATRVVLLSSGAVHDDAAEQHDELARWHKVIEDAVTGSGLAWTILRPFEFAANTLAQWGPQIKYTGVVRGPYPDSVSSAIHERDVAEVAARALRSGAHDGAVYQLTGPKSLTRAEMVGIIGEAVGREVPFERVPREAAYAAMLQATGFAPEIVETMLNLQERSVGGEAYVTGDVERVLGRPALDFAQWAADHAADFS